MLDDAVFSCRIHALQDNENRPMTVGVERLLQSRKFLRVFGSHRFAGGLRDSRGIGGVAISERELIRPLDTEASNELGEVHRQRHIRARKAGMKSGMLGCKSAFPRTIRISHNSGSAPLPR